MDLLLRIKDGLIIFISSWLNHNISFFIIRVGLMLSITYGLLSLMLCSPVRTIFFQVCAAFLGIIVSLNIPLYAFEETSRGSFTTIVIFFFLCIVFLPNWLPAFLVPRYGDQLRLKKILRWIVWGLFILQIITG